jgi:tRNA U34 5-carboxymethylaminomethyl modifying GTPase MnmE/TrmE
VRTLYDPSFPPSKESILDPGSLVLYFPAPKTVTGEDILELHVHGGPAVVSAVLAAIPRCLPAVGGSSLPVRYAEPGEFTRRAFMNNRLSLPQIEALGDTLAAETEQQRRLSVRGASSNRLAQTYESWRQQLLYARGELEALIDFSEDQHFEESPAKLVKGVTRQVHHLLGRLRLHSQNAMKGELLRNGISLALLGPPNAGKSSLLNRIVGREAAIVSREAGTTRDVVEIGVDLGGWFVRIGDTAGLRAEQPHTNGHDTKQNGMTQTQAPTSIGEIEQEGIRRAKERALSADVVLVVLALEPNPHHPQAPPTISIDPEVLSTARRCNQQSNNVLIAINKTDLHAPTPSDRIGEQTSAALQAQNSISQAMITGLFPDIPPSRIFGISCKDAACASPSPSAPSPSPDPMAGAAGQAAGSVPHVSDHQFATHPRNPHQQHPQKPPDTTADANADADAAAAAAVSGVGTARAAARTGTPDAPPSFSGTHLQDPGGIQALLRGLIGTFAAITQPLMMIPPPAAAADAIDSDGHQTRPGESGPAPSPDVSIWQESLGATARQRRLLDTCVGYLEAFLLDVGVEISQRAHVSNDAGAIPTGEAAGAGADAHVGEEVDVVVAAEHLRAAAECLAKITGKGEAGDVEEVLGVVFEK